MIFLPFCRQSLHTADNFHFCVQVFLLNLFCSNFIHLQHLHLYYGYYPLLLPLTSLFLPKGPLLLSGFFCDLLGLVMVDYRSMGIRYLLVHGKSSSIYTTEAKSPFLAVTSLSTAPQGGIPHSIHAGMLKA